MFESLAVDPKTAAAIDLAVQENRLPHAVILEGGDEETRRKRDCLCARLHRGGTQTLRRVCKMQKGTGRQPPGPVFD